MLSKLFTSIKQSTLLQNLLRSDLRVFLILTSVALYAFYLQRQYIDIFFESQFLHINFLEGLAQGKITSKGFFTVFGEHLFPGYNLILAVNYYLFNIWGGFDSVIYFASLVASLLIFTKVIQSIPSLLGVKYNIAIAFSVFTLISTTNNPQWGMALASSVGVSIMLYCIYQLNLFLNGSRKNISLMAILSIPAAIIFFLGGYSIGFISAIFIIIFFSFLQEKSNLLRSKYIILTALISVAVYAAIVINYGSLIANRPQGDSFQILASIKFFLIMIGSSLLGRATFEALHSTIPYYICGLVLTSWAFFACLHYVRNSLKESFFFTAILIYSIVNTLAVSVFRYKNGLEGAMGQWYNAHTHFIAPIVIIYILVTLNRSESIFIKTLKYLSILVLVLAALIGYYADMRKAPYTKLWKQQFTDQVQVLLASPDDISDKKNAFNTMLWSYPEAKAGIDFLYRSSLWAFKNKAPVVDGSTADNWVTADKQVVIICPSGTKFISFESWRPEGLPQASVKILTSNSSSNLDVTNSTSSFQVNPDLAFIRIIAKEESSPITSSNDPRHLVFIIKNISCGAVSQERSLQPEVQIVDWGPKTSEKGKVPNPQPDGGAGFWVNISGNSEQLINDGAEIFIGEIKGENLTIQKDLITASFSSSITDRSGELKIYIRNKVTGKQTQIGTFTIN